MQTLFIVPTRKKARWLTVYGGGGLILFLLPPSALLAQDVSDLKRKAQQGDASAQVDLGLAYRMAKASPKITRKPSNGTENPQNKAMRSAKAT